MKTVQSMLDEANAAVPRISPDEAKKLVGKADVLFLDVREPPEVVASGKVPGAGSYDSDHGGDELAGGAGASRAS